MLFRILIIALEKSMSIEVNRFINNTKLFSPLRDAKGPHSTKQPAIVPRNYILRF